MRRDRGQATVEFALIVPLVVVVVLAVVQVAVVAYAQLAVTHAAREVARTIVVDPGIDSDRAVANVGLLASDDLSTSVSFENSGVDMVDVVVSYEVPSISRLFEPLLGDLQVRGHVRMLAESG